MGRTIHPTFHQPSGRVTTVGDVFANAKVAVFLSFDSLNNRRAVAPLVRHLAVSGHVLGMRLGGRLELGTDHKRRQLGFRANAVMRLNHLDTQGREIGVSFRFLTDNTCPFVPNLV